MAIEFYYQVNGKTLGPVIGIEIRNKAVEGVINRDTSVKIGVGNWAPASKIKGLFDSQGNPISNESYFKDSLEPALAPKLPTHNAEPPIPSCEDTPVDSSTLHRTSSGSSTCSVQPVANESVAKHDHQRLQGTPQTFTSQQVSVMKFRITGADTSTGKDRQLVIEADNEDAAVIEAQFEGVYPYNVQPVVENAPLDQPDEQFQFVVSASRKMKLGLGFPCE